MGISVINSVKSFIEGGCNANQTTAGNRTPSAGYREENRREHRGIDAKVLERVISDAIEGQENHSAEDRADV